MGPSSCLLEQTLATSSSEFASLCLQVICCYTAGPFAPFSFQPQISLPQLILCPPPTFLPQSISCYFIHLPSGHLLPTCTKPPTWKAAFTHILPLHFQVLLKGRRYHLPAFNLLQTVKVKSTFIRATLGRLEILESRLWPHIRRKGLDYEQKRLRVVVLSYERKRRALVKN